MLSPVKKEIRVDFVAHDDQIVLKNDLRDGFELGSGENAAARVVGVAKEEHTGAGINCGLECLDVDRPLAVPKEQSIFTQFAAGFSDGTQERGIDRCLHDNTVAGCRIGEERQIHTLDNLSQNLHIDWIDRPIEPVRHALGKSFAQACVRGGDRVADIPAIN